MLKTKIQGQKTSTFTTHLYTIAFKARITVLSAFLGIQRNLVRSVTAKAKNRIYKLYIIG